MAQTNTPASGWREGASAAAEPNTGSTAGVGQYSSVVNKIKGVIPGTWEHEAKKDNPNVRPHLEKDQATVGMGNELVAPGAGGMHTEATGHHGHHFTGHTDAAAPGATGDAGMMAPGATTGAGMTAPGAATGTGMTAPGATTGAGMTAPGATTGAGMTAPGATTGAGMTAPGAAGGAGVTAPGATAGHAMPTGEGHKEGIKEKIFKHIPGTHEYAEQHSGNAAHKTGTT